MSPDNSKPEWFQMAQADPIAPKPRSKRVVRIMALATPLLILGAGLVFAQTQNSPTAVASASTPVAIAASAPAAAIQAATTTQSASITIKKSGIKPPTGGGEDDGLVRSSDND